MLASWLYRQPSALLLVQPLEDARLPHVFPYGLVGSGAVGAQFLCCDFDEAPPEGAELCRLVDNCALFEAKLLDSHAQVRLLGVLIIVEELRLLAAEGTQAGPKQVLGGVAVIHYQILQFDALRLVFQNLEEGDEEVTLGTVAPDLVGGFKAHWSSSSIFLHVRESTSALRGAPLGSGGTDFLSGSVGWDSRVLLVRLFILELNK